MQASYPDFNHLLHALRTVALRQMAYRPDTMISVGCAGSWYFDWVHQSFHVPSLHIGVEYYSPKPDVLPDNVAWIQNTASDMSGVGDAEADLLFSGQNVEHLFPGEIARFFLEAHRVIKPGGVIVLDSPNRIQTSKLQWNQPEHFIEFTPAEITDVLLGSGFSVPRLRGIWLCEEPVTGRPLPLDRMEGDDLLWRSLAAADNPDLSFVWWAELQRLDVQPDVDRLHSLVERIVEDAWSDRLARQQTMIGDLFNDETGAWFVARREASGPLLFGPYAPLEKGRYRVEFLLRIDDVAAGKDEIAYVDVMADRGTGRLGEAVVKASDIPAGGLVRPAIEFTLAETTFGIEFRVLTTGAAIVAARRGVILRPLAAGEDRGD